VDEPDISENSKTSSTHGIDTENEQQTKPVEAVAQTKRLTEDIEPSSLTRLVRWFKKKAGEAHLADWATVVFTFVIAAATIAYTVYGRRQWQVMSGQLEEMRSGGRDTHALAEAAQRSAKAAENALNDARNNFIRDQRPYVMVASVKPAPLTVGMRISVNLYWVNYGKSPAINAKGSGLIFFGPKAMQQADQWF